ncbi:MAG TPA: ABC transporter substrate-binding protein [Lachnospiraceae bacterium]|nr:ABC transporter substrate-binding protein [Lachnospiraceae bacterium]
MKNRKWTYRLLAVLLAAAMVVMTGCSSSSKSDSSTAESGTESSLAESSEAQSSAVESSTAESSAAELSSTAGAVSFTDQAGRQIDLDKPADKIVALTASDCEILYALGAQDKLVGRGEYCDYPAEVADIPSVQSGSDTNIEQILDLKPDVVIMATMDQTTDQVQQLENAGVKVVVSDAQDIAGTYDAITMLGTLTGKESEAADIIQTMKDSFDKIKESPVEGGTIYFEVSPLQYGLWAAGKGTFMDEIATMMGLTNIFEDVDGWGEVSEEQVLERNPDYIVTISMYTGEGPTPVEEIEQRSGWQDVKAVKNEAILDLDDNSLSRPVPRLADGAKALYDFVKDHPAQ